MWRQGRIGVQQVTLNGQLGSTSLGACMELTPQSNLEGDGGEGAGNSSTSSQRSLVEGCSRGGIHCLALS